MRRLPFLLRPGWLALALVVVVFAYLCFTVLAPWQLGKNTSTSRENGQIERSLNTDPVALTTDTSPSSPSGDGLSCGWEMNPRIRSSTERGIRGVDSGSSSWCSCATTIG